MIVTEYLTLCHLDVHADLPVTLDAGCLQRTKSLLFKNFRFKLSRVFAFLDLHEPEISSAQVSRTDSLGQ